jgi:uncharacterized membrane protein YkvA (DUF1232 family)
MAESSNEARTEDQKDDMGTTLTSSATDVGFWREMWRQARMAWYLVRSPDVPLYLKVLPALAVIYVLVPTDFIPDVFPVIGQLDDITALLVGVKVFIELAPQDVVSRYVQSVRQSSAPAASSESDSAGQSDPAEQLQDDPENLIVIEGDYDVVENSNGDQAD